jgi:predicted site-specific integrase-resolvase
MDTNIDLDNMVPLNEAPNHVPIAEKTLRNWRCQGRYPQIFIKIGGKVFLDVSEFKSILRRQKEKNIKNARRFGLYD